MAGSGFRYFIFVEAKDEIMEVGGLFTLYIEETSSNTLCSNAIGPLLGDESLTFGSTSSATLVDARAAQMNDLTSRGVWYTMIGTGKNLTATTCSRHTNFETSVKVFRGSCESLERVEISRLGETCELGTNAQWTSDDQELYYVLVSGVEISDYGNFALSIADRVIV
jgi:hypothetical protein